MVTIAVLTSVGRTLDAFFPEIVDEWHRRGHTVVTASSDESRVGIHTKIKSLTRKPSLRNARARAEIAKWLARTDAEVLITNTAVASFLARSGKQPCPVIYFCHGLHWNTGKRFGEKLWQSLEKAVLRHTDAVIAINSDDEEWFAAMAPDMPRTRLTAGVGLDLTKFRYSERLPTSGGPNLVWIGEFSERKRPELAVEVVKTLAKMGSTAALAMCGEGDLLPQVRQAVESSALQERIELLGQRSNVADLIANSDALIITSRWEGLPRVALEAIAVGRPVIGYDVKGVRSVPGIRLAPDGDHEEFSRLVLAASKGELGASPDARRSLDFTVAAREIDEMVREVLRSRGSRS